MGSVGPVTGRQLRRYRKEDEKRKRPTPRASSPSGDPVVIAYRVAESKIEPVDLPCQLTGRFDSCSNEAIVGSPGVLPVKKIASI